MRIGNGVIILFLAFGLQVLMAENKPKVIAHRGYSKTEGSAQNSIQALEHSGKLGVYGSEFDVIITSDGVPVVNHDDTFQGKRVEKSSYSFLKTLKLPNGEAFSSLEEYIIAGKRYPDMQLILEVKPHSSPVKDIEAAQRIAALVQKMGVRKQVEYITFSLIAGKELIRLDPQAKVAYLNGELSPKELKDLGFTGLDYNYKVIQKNPSWIKEAHDLGLSVNVWTVNTSGIMENMISEGVDFITTDEPLMLIQQLKK